MEYTQKPLENIILILFFFLIWEADHFRGMTYNIYTFKYFKQITVLA